MMQRGAGRRDLGEQQIEEGQLPVAVERRGRLVGDDQLRAADQRARRGDALLLADAQARRRKAVELGGVEPEAREQAQRLALGRAVAARPLAPLRAQSSSGSSTLSRIEP